MRDQDGEEYILEVTITSTREVAKDMLKAKDDIISKIEDLSDWYRWRQLGVEIKFTKKQHIIYGQGWDAQKAGK